MNAPDNIYIEVNGNGEVCSGIWYYREQDDSYSETYYRHDLYAAVERLSTRLDDLVSAAKNQMCAQGNEAECWDGLHSCCKPELRDAIMRIKPPAIKSE